MHSKKICHPWSRLRNFEEHRLKESQIIGLPGVPTYFRFAIAYEINTPAVVCVTPFNLCIRLQIFTALGVTVMSLDATCMSYCLILYSKQ